jgi:hypothetical protein
LSPEAQDRVWQYVARGGSLLIVADPFGVREGLDGSFDELLGPVQLSAAEDLAISETGNWQHARQVLSHPATVGMGVRSNRFFADAGTLIRTGAMTRPLVVGRWGWVDPGGDAAVTGAYRLESGEELGDLVLAAEQPYGKGTVIVLGDGRSLTNEGMVFGYPLVGRLLSYLANRPWSPQALWRQLLGLVLCLVLVGLLYWCLDPPNLGLVSAALIASLTIVSAANRKVGQVVPDGRVLADRDAADCRQLAYIDASHLEAYNETDWGFDAVNGLSLTLMRNGYLTLALPAMTREHLERAAVLVSMGPARRFSASDRKLLRQFVQSGGILISTVGAEEARASEGLLADFGLRVPASPVPTRGSQREPEPMGRFRTLFLNAQDYGAGDYKVGVLFHAGWPVEGGTEVLAYGRDDRPIVVCRALGQGKLVLIGDTGFAMNKNLEYVGGEPFDGGYENAHFWRWLLTRITGRTEWIPPPAPEVPAADMPAGDVPTNDRPVDPGPEPPSDAAREPEVVN